MKKVRHVQKIGILLRIYAFESDFSMFLLFFGVYEWSVDSSLPFTGHIGQIKHSKRPGQTYRYVQNNILCTLPIWAKKGCESHCESHYESHCESHCESHYENGPQITNFENLQN